MSVPSKSFGALLKSAARRLSLLEDDGSVSAENSGDLTDLINSAMRHAWQFYPWPDSVAMAEEPVIEHPVVQGAMYVPRQTVGRTLATVFNVWSADPRQVQRQGRLVSHSKRADGLYLHESISTVWVDYRDEPPEYTDETWNNATEYAVGDLVLGSDGHVYRCTETSEGDDPTEGHSWKPVVVLACLFEPVKQGVISHFKRFQSGQPVTAKSFETLMLDLLEHEIQLLQTQEGQTLSYA